jgi:hypothetical protein
MEGEKMEVVHRDRKKLSSVFLYPKTIVTVDQHGSSYSRVTGAMDA